MLKVEDITVEKLRKGELKKELSEFYELQRVVENNEWHDHENVFDHTLAVLESLEKLMEEANENVKKQLGKTVDKHTRKQLLFLAALLHDVGKKETLEEVGASTSAQDHEIQGAAKAMDVMKKMNVSSKEKKFVADIVRFHGEAHYILLSTNRRRDNDFEDFKKRHSDMFIELVLLGMADTVTSRLQETDSEDYASRLAFYHHVIDNY